MATPEKKVKERVKKILDKYPFHYKFFPSSGGYGSSGVPDIVACVEGKFIAVECKADGNKPTALQLKNLRDIAAAGGYAFVVDETGTGLLSMTLAEIMVGNLRAPGTWDFTAGTKCDDADTSKA